MTENLKVAMAQFKKRKAQSAKKKQIDSSSLPAGSPMYYYCRFCGELTEVLSEGHINRPRTVCTPCEFLNQHGLI